MPSGSGLPLNACLYEFSSMGFNKVEWITLAALFLVFVSFMFLVYFKTKILRKTERMEIQNNLEK